ncbi:CDAN1-interacting nuclease 1-like isoform X2 [Antedon mediterranea]|uniref:CDAN1-interacting nuclease 1-like isoform X2 n=1 Tax=Antedon mediterranea TaxID=105859 RepID=UPI003AF548C7
MIMKQGEYAAIADMLKQPRTSEDAINSTLKAFPNLNYKTAVAIYSQIVQRKVKSSLHKHQKAEMVKCYYEEYVVNSKKDPCGPVMLNLAMKVDLPPALFARMILEQHLINSDDNEDENVSKLQVNQLLKDTHLIQDPVLSFQVQQAVLNDMTYGPIVESIKHSVGNEYEFLLKSHLKKNNISFIREEEMRSKGYDKTPDIKLQIPIAMDGYIINWIESKASFGDKVSQANYLKDQFWSYVNRFGSGLVIYWFGYIEELDVHRDRGIALAQHFPNSLVTFNPLKVENRVHNS